MNEKADPLAYDLVFSVPTMEFSARVGRSGKYSAPLMDELLIRVLHAAGSLSMGAVASLLRLTVVQLESFLEPLLRSNLLTMTNEGLIALGARGVAAMSYAAGEPPKLTKVEEGSEVFRIDLIDSSFCVTPKDRRPFLDSIVIQPTVGIGRDGVRATAAKLLMEDYAQHGQYLFDHGYRYSPPKEVEYVIDIDEGRGTKSDVNVQVRLDDSGRGYLRFSDLHSGEQLQLRRQTVERIGGICGKLGAGSSTQSRKLFASLADAARDGVSDGASVDAGDECWRDETIVCNGRLESRDSGSVLRLVDRVATRLSLLKGDQERFGDWVLVLGSKAEAFAKGRDYLQLLKATLERIKKRSARSKILLVLPEGLPVPNENSLMAKFFDGIAVAGKDSELDGIDGLFVPNEMAYLAVISPGLDGGVPSYRCITTSDSNTARQIARRIFSSPAFDSMTVVKGIDEAGWIALRSRLRIRADADEAKVLRLKGSLLRKNPDSSDSSE